VLPLVQRLVLTGWLLLIPSSHDAWRIFAGLLVAVGYLTLLQFVRPYKRSTINLLATAVQFSLVCVYLGGAFVKVFADSTTVAADDDGDDGDDEDSSTAKFRVVVVMVVFNFAVLALFVSLAAYQFATRDVLPSIRLVTSKQVPELKLRKGEKWHLFLSHIWSSGQDQMATVKRCLTLLLPGVRIFLDVDDLEAIGNLGQYIKASSSVLIFLSKGYFFSGNCRKELEAALAYDSPMILLHETDLNRGGAPLKQLRDDCAAEHRSRVFAPDRPIIPWQRIKEFQLVSLKMIVGSMLQQQRPTKVAAALKSPDSPTSPRSPGLSSTSRATEADAEDAEDSQLDASTTPRPRLSAMPGSEAKKKRWERRSSNAGGVGALGSDLFVPGEITRASLGFLRATQLITSPNNPGATELAGEMAADDPQLQLRTPSAWKSSRGMGTSFGRSFGATIFGASNGGGSGSGSFRGPSLEAAFGRGRAHFLLYLNKWTFLGEEGSKLAVEVAEAKTMGLSIVLAHETDEARGGCEFGLFFQTTPQELIAGGLYAKIAVAFQPGAHRDVSYCLLAKDLGATRNRLGEVLATKIEQRSQEARQRVVAAAQPVVLLSRRSSSLVSRASSVISVQRSKSSHCSSVGEKTAPAAAPTDENTPPPLVLPGSSSVNEDSAIDPAAIDAELENDGADVGGGEGEPAGDCDAGPSRYV